jgi:predicted TIM-barrel fold metal-dependent hydrolase
MPDQLRIDTHHHFVPPEWLASKRTALIEEIGPQIAFLEQWTAEKSLAEMDVNGIGTAILSLTTPAVRSDDVQAARRLARSCNEYGAGLAGRFPGRFGTFATLPIPDIDGSLEELRYALDVLKLDGVGLLATYGELWPGDPILAPLIDELDRRRAVVFVHPAAGACCSHAVMDIPAPIIEFEFNLTRAAASLVFSGSLTRCPNIRWLFSHGAGALPMLATRMATTSYARRPDVIARLPNGVLPELQKLYFDCNSAANAPAMAALLAFAPANRITFGTDYPIISASVTISGLTSLDLAPQIRRAIDFETSHQLFPRFAV